MPKTSKERISEQFLAAADDAASALRSQSELDLITGLCRELAKLGVPVSMSDARPTAMVPNACRPFVLVTVDCSGEFFEWGNPQERHAVADIAGAAARILERVKAQRSGSGEAS